jgi:hypothetical protein
MSDASRDKSDRNPILKFLLLTSELEIMENRPQRNISGLHSSKIKTVGGYQNFRGTCYLLP